MFMWMLQDDKLEKIMKYQNVYMWMLHDKLEEIIKDQNVYVNVAW
jgi:hypothetical protein